MSESKAGVRGKPNQARVNPRPLSLNFIGCTRGDTPQLPIGHSYPTPAQTSEYYNGTRGFLFDLRLNVGDEKTRQDSSSVSSSRNVTLPTWGAMVPLLASICVCTILFTTITR